MPRAISPSKGHYVPCSPMASGRIRSPIMARPERSFRTEAIILRRHDFAEADRLLTIYTRKHGKKRAMAKGSRKPAGRKTGHVELYTRVMMMINGGRELHVVSQAELVEPYLPVREDLERGAYASY